MNKYIGIFQISPVQEYINQAKRTQDFWAGSYILSYLSAVAIETLIYQSGDCIVYPFFDENPFKLVVSGKPHLPREHDFDVLDNERIGTLPNRFVAVLEDRESLKNALKQSQVNVGHAYDEIVRKVKERLKTDLKPDINTSIFNDDLWQRQNDNFFYTMWVIYERQHQIYGEDYQYAERLFGARKSIRNFEQTPGESGKKCNLCGEREPIHQDFWNILERWHPDNSNNIFNKIRYSFRKNERLCSVCLVKRLAPEIVFETKKEKESRLIFPSTSTIAVAPAMCRLIEKWDQNDVPKQLTSFIQKLSVLKLDYPKNVPPIPFIEKCAQKIKYTENKNILKWDGDVFLDTTYQKKILVDDYCMSRDVEWKKVHDCVNELKKLMKTIKPSKYYAIVMMDGDNMGQYLSGCKTMEAHKQFSRQLSEFARRTVPNVCESFFTSKVSYFGGDEGILFVGKDDLFQLMRCLRAAFSGHLGNQCCVNFFAPRTPQQPDLGTACMGAVVAHHQQSLLRVIEVLHASLEEKAKKADKKDAFCITLMKRSGGTTHAISKWYYDNCDVLNHLDQMRQLYQQGYLTDAWLYDLDRKKHAFGKNENIFSEILRLLQRHARDESVFLEHIQPMIKDIQQIYNGMLLSVNFLENFIQLEFCAQYLARDKQ